LAQDLPVAMSPSYLVRDRTFQCEPKFQFEKSFVVSRVGLEAEGAAQVDGVRYPTTVGEELEKQGSMTWEDQCGHLLPTNLDVPSLLRAATQKRIRMTPPLSDLLRVVDEKSS
jgi:hypothetical protein